jgi:hypothetical protein
MIKDKLFHASNGLCSKSYQIPASGFLLPALLFATTFIVAVGLVTAQLALSNLGQATNEGYRLETQFAADAGLDYGIQNLNQNGAWSGTSGEVVLMQDSRSKTTFQTTVTNDADPFKKFMDVTARSYVPATSVNPKVERKFEVQLRGVSGGSYAVVTGVGGLIMNNNAKIVGGDVYVNGEITMSNSAQIGLTTSPVNVKAAHQNCPEPADATYPRVCNSGENGQPITLNNNAKMYGEVRATNQTSGTNMFNPGLVAGGAPPAALPSHDRSALVNAVNASGNVLTSSQASCSSGTKTWPANTKITGSVSVTNSCKVTIEGDIWITGDISVSNSAELHVKNGLTAPPVIMIDGVSGFRISNGAKLQSNNASPTPIGFRIITYWSQAGCSPDCADVTGTALYNSRNTTTIELDNNSSAPQTEFYARWSRVKITNSGNVGALVGQTVEISNSGTITFGTSVTGVGGVSAWAIQSYKRTF